jgi:hypothetical protein
MVPRPQDGESEAPKRSGFSSLGKIRVFRRDVPESFGGDSNHNLLGNISSQYPSGSLMK